MNSTELAAKIVTATGILDDAVARLEEVISEIKDAPRAEKIGVSAVVEEAFDKLAGARSVLEELQSLLDAGEDT